MPKPRTKFSMFLAKLNWTTEELAREIGYPVKTVSSWRSGARNPHIGARDKLSEALGITNRQLNRLLETNR